MGGKTHGSSARCASPPVSPASLCLRTIAASSSAFWRYLLVFAIFTLVALRSDRFWPLWISGLQLTATLGHALKAIEFDLVPIAYAVSLRFWSYPILIILAVGTWRSRQRLRSLGRPVHI